MLWQCLNSVSLVNGALTYTTSHVLAACYTGSQAVFTLAQAGYMCVTASSLEGQLHGSPGQDMARLQVVMS